VDHAGDADAAMRCCDALREIAEGVGVESILRDRHPKMLDGVVDAGRVIRAALQTRARSGTPLGQLTITGDGVDDLRLVRACMHTDGEDLTIGPGVGTAGKDPGQIKKVQTECGLCSLGA
jgi:hypothetical protein